MAKHKGNLAPASALPAFRSKRVIGELVLRGHGVLGLAHIGVLRACAEKGVRVPRITGMSLSSVIATLHANGRDANAIEGLFLNEQVRHVLRDAWLGHGPCERPALGNMVHDLLPTARQLVETLKLKPQAGLKLLAFDVVTASTVAFQGTGYDLVMALTACCSVAGVMRPIRVGDSVLVDCSLNGCRLDSPCQGAMVVSDASVAGTAVDDGALSHVDRWLHTRARLIGPDISCFNVVNGACRSIDIRIPAETISECGCSEEQIRRIINAGYDAAMQALAA
jgi:hypothetical protein